MKAGSYTNPSMLNTVVMFICTALHGKHPFGANLVHIIKIASLS